MTDILYMTPEQYEDAHKAANLHKMQDFIDSANASEYGMSVNGFKNANSILKERRKVLKSLKQKIEVGLGHYEVQDERKIEQGRNVLKSMGGVF